MIINSDFIAVKYYIYMYINLFILIFVYIMVYGLDAMVFGMGGEAGCLFELFRYSILTVILRNRPKRPSTISAYTACIVISYISWLLVASEHVHGLGPT